MLVFALYFCLSIILWQYQPKFTTCLLSLHASSCKIWQHSNDESQCYPVLQVDYMKHFAEPSCSIHFIPLERHCHTAAIGSLCQLLDGVCQEHLQIKCFLSLISLPKTFQYLNICDHFVGEFHCNCLLGLAAGCAAKNQSNACEQKHITW